MSKLGEKIRAGRESWLELDEPPRRALKIRRMPGVEMIALRQGKVDFETCCACVVDWRGYSEAEFLGTAVGSSDPTEFDPDALRELLGDDTDLLKRVSTHLAKLVGEYLKKRGETEKN